MAVTELAPLRAGQQPRGHSGQPDIADPAGVVSPLIVPAILV